MDKLTDEEKKDLIGKATGDDVGPHQQAGVIIEGIFDFENYIDELTKTITSSNRQIAKLNALIVLLSLALLIVGLKEINVI